MNGQKKDLGHGRIGLHRDQNRVRNHVREYYRDNTKIKMIYALLRNIDSFSPLSWNISSNMRYIASFSSTSKLSYMSSTSSRGRFSFSYSRRWYWYTSRPWFYEEENTLSDKDYINI